ncbi:MAG: hypothetical protein V4726_01185 [Verrucomicrobiota bacterium]
MSRAFSRAVLTAALLSGPAHAQNAVPAAVLVPAVPAVPAAPATKVETAPAPAGTAAAAPGTPAPAAPAVPEAPKAPPILETLKKAAFTRLASDAFREWSATANPVPPPPAVEGAPAPDPGALAVEALRKEVGRGNWPALGAFFKERFPDKPEDAKQAWKHILGALASQGGPGVKPRTITPQMQMQGMGGDGGQPPKEMNILSTNDVLDLAEQCPFPFEKDKETLEQLGRLFAGAIDRGNVPDEAIRRLEKGTANLGGTDTVKRRDAARLLVAAGLRIEAESFLAKQADALAAKDIATLNLLAMAAEGRFAKDGKPEDLEKAWRITQDALSIPDTSAMAAERQLSLRRAVELAPKVKAELGAKWLSDSFTAKPALGMEILAGIGIATADSRKLPAAEPRQQNLELQNRAVNALLKASPERAKEWKIPLTLLAMNWLNEAEWTQARDNSSSRGPQMQFDMYGNVFFGGDMPENMGGQPGGRRPIKAGEILTLSPGDAWIEAVDSSLRPALLIQLANLQLKVKMEKDAFPYIEKLAAANPREARELADRFIEVWGENHDPNADKNRTNRYMFIYGYNPQADGIPLTRSRQERNLTELAEWVKKLRAMPLGGLDEEKVAKAFMRTHSSAEVFRMDNIVKVFGGLDQLKPETLAAILQSMRQNLATVWRSPKEQQAKKTNRTDKEMEAEVARGYGVTSRIVNEARSRFPDDWRLLLAQAALMLDSTNFANEKAKDSTFSKDREESFAAFAKAAELYAKALPGLEQKDQSVDVYLTWFYASLGASDLEAVKAEQTPSPKQVPLIRAALEALPGEAKERHETLFANALATRMTAAAPAVKHRYLSQGLPIAGDNERAREPRQLMAYYSDLVTEIRLQAAIDGPDTVGTEPFGVFVNIRHTTQIEREAGGFQKYLQNQNTGMGFYNFGRPPENYRDKFEEAAREALKESFEVQSVTFHTDKVKSAGDPEDGWRVTPYCYLLLKAKGPQTDSLPPLKLNLDFMDTSGYAVLPIETNKIPLDAAHSAARPAVAIEVQEILDERKADKGVLGLEIKATARGLVPALDTLFDLKPAGFEIEKIDDQGVRVTQLDTGEEHPGNFGAPVSERLWTVTLKAASGQAAPAKSFTFAQPKSTDVKALFMRYADADLQEVPATVNLEETYGKPSRAWLWWTLSVSAAVIAVAVWLYSRRKKTVRSVQDDIEAPEEINPLTVMALLRRIRSSGRLQPDSAAELNRTLTSMEEHYYAPTRDSHGPDLNATATEWLRKASAV